MTTRIRLVVALSTAALAAAVGACGGGAEPAADPPKLDASAEDSDSKSRRPEKS